MQTLWMEEDPFGIRGSRTRASIATTTPAITLNAPEPYTLSKQFRRHSSYSYKIVININPNIFDFLSIYFLERFYHVFF